VVSDNPRVVIGDNNPPEPTPYEAISLHVSDLAETAQGFLDGEPITTQVMADEVGKLLAAAREAEKAAEAQRKIEAKPFDDGKAAVQALWTPIKAKCSLVSDTAKKALAPFLEAEQAKRDAAAVEARKEAEAKAKAAQDALRAIDATNLAEREAAEQLLKDAGKAERLANKAEKGKALVAGGARSVSLRSVWSAELTDRREALSHYMREQPDALADWLIDQANKDVAAGVRSIPGFTIKDKKVAQ